MISRLGDFLRLTLENGGTSEVSLQRELEFLQGYLEIERIRFKDRLTTTINVDPSVLDVQVPNLILQPIVENAMRHAIARTNSGEVEISAVPRNGAVRIEVKDNVLAVDLYLILKKHMNIREVSRNVQMQVARALQEMVGMDIGKVEIHIEDIDYEELEAESG